MHKLERDECFKAIMAQPLRSLVVAITLVAATAPLTVQSATAAASGHDQLT